MIESYCLLGILKDSECNYLDYHARPSVEIIISKSIRSTFIWNEAEKTPQIFAPPPSPTFFNIS